MAAPPLPCASASTIPSRTFSDKLYHSKELILSALHLYPNHTMMSTSFGIQSAVLLHLVTSLHSTLPIIWIDTGYLPKETYQYAKQLQILWNLNLNIYQSSLTPAHMEAIHGKLWESSDPSDRRLYGLIRKVIPMKQAQQELQTKCLLIGLRKQQTRFRQQLNEIEYPEEGGGGGGGGGEGDCCKYYPLLHWTDEDIEQYFDLYQLPRHPLSAQGYTTVGDGHSSRPKNLNDFDDRLTRFGGTGQQECGLHTESGSFESLQSLSATAPSLHHSLLPSPIMESHLATSPISVENFPVDSSAGAMRASSGGSDYILYTRPACQYCRAAKLLMKQKGFSYHEILVTEREPNYLQKSTSNTSEISTRELTSLIQRTRNDFNYSVTTVPQIFISQGEPPQHIGGFTDLCFILSLPDDEKDKYLQLSQVQPK